MKMLTEFHLSRNSIVVSDDNYARRLKRIARAHMPREEDFPQIARELMERVFTSAASDRGEQSIHLSERLIRELYRTMLDSVLGKRE